jgi:MIP family channel proteins
MTTQSNIGMEDLSSSEALKASVAELVATALFVMVGVGSIAIAFAGGGVVGVAAAHGFAFALLVAGTAAISGGHLNPAISFAMMITGQITLIRGLMYIVAQLLGACIGALLLRAFIVDEVLRGIAGGGGQALSPAVDQAWQGMFLEALGTFVLVWTVFAVVVNPRAGLGGVAPLYVGLAVLVVYLFLIPLTGAGINPARTFGPALFLPATESDSGLPGRWSDAWIYYLGPLLGAATASLSYYLLYLMPPKRSG